MIKLKFRKLINALGEPNSGQAPGPLLKLAGVTNAMRLKTKMRITRLVEAVIEMYTEFGEERNKLVEEFARPHPETGEVMRDHTGEAVFENKEKRISFQAKIDLLLDREVELPGEKFTPADLMVRANKESLSPNVTLIDAFSAFDLMQLLWLLDDERLNEFADLVWAAEEKELAESKMVKAATPGEK